MKLVIDRTDIENAFVYKYGVQRHEIEIQMDTLSDILDQPTIPSVPKINSIHDADVRIAIASIFDEAMTIQDNYREGREISPNKISLIKAVRTLVPNTSLKDAKDYVENNLLNYNF